MLRRISNPDHITAVHGIPREQNWLVLLGWEEWHTFSPLPIKATKANNECPGAHACRRGQISSDGGTLHDQQLENIRRLAPRVS